MPTTRPTYAPLGCKTISLFGLNKNKLYLVRGKTRKPCFKQELITDDLKSVLKSLIKGDYAIEEKVDLLSDYDQKLLNTVLEKCGIDNVFSISEYHKNVGKNKLIQQFNVMKDEILIGNDSQELFDEFDELLDELVQRKMITVTEFKKLKSLIPST